MSTLKVDGIRSNSASSDAITLAGDGTCTANITNNLSNRRLTINGDMRIAQRGVSSTVSGYGSVDRFAVKYSGTDEAPTQAQVDVASGTTPYTLGFRKSLKVTNGNQTSGAGAADFIRIYTTLEAQDLANSGWNYTSSSSYITLSFWIKSSVAQNFYGRLYTYDGTNQNYAFETGSLSADTWTKITKAIPGNSNITFDNNANSGLNIEFGMFRGTDTTGSVSLNTWAAYASGTRTPNQTSTWYTTNDATFEITGVQLEVGSNSTDYEFRSYGQELALCQRYYQKSFEQGTTPAHGVGKGIYQYIKPYASDYIAGLCHYLPVEMRSTPTVVTYTLNSVTNSTDNRFSHYNNSSWGVCALSLEGSSNPRTIAFGGQTGSSSTVLVQYNFTASAEL